MVVFLFSTFCLSFCVFCVFVLCCLSFLTVCKFVYFLCTILTTIVETQLQLININLTLRVNTVLTVVMRLY